ncbi:MAG TPA: hypothetical protein VFB78_14015 [Acidimicrobiales bacterium]|nr:hypothetical protein [Acidimicrobiales bacterium]
MTGWDRDGAVVTQRRALSSPGDAAEVPGVDLPTSMGEWLARLGLLEAVPFDYLVPDARMLPFDSMRFFYVDRNWIDALIDGAFAIGKQSSRDALHHEAHAVAIRDTGDRASSAARAVLRGVAAAVDTPPPDAIMTGLVMRSSVVSGYPGLEIRAYTDSTRATRVRLLRLDRVAPDVLFVLFDGVPALVDVCEPPEGLHFGAVRTDSGPETADKYQVMLRWVDTKTGPQPHASGDQVKEGCGKAVPVDVPLRSGGNRVVDVAALQRALGDALTVRGGASGPLPPKDMAIEMVMAAERLTFKTERAGLLADSTSDA